MNADEEAIREHLREKGIDLQILSTGCDCAGIEVIVTLDDGSELRFLESYFTTETHEETVKRRRDEERQSLLNSFHLGDSNV